MEILLWIVAFFVVLSPLVFVHELGHFVVAKLTGVHVEEFGLFFPPRLLRLWREAGRLWIGGQKLRIPGRFAWPKDVDEGDDVAALVREDPRNGPTLTRIVAVDPQQPPVLLTPEAGEREVRGTIERLERGTEYTLNLIPLGGFVRPKGEDDPTIPGGLSSATKRVRIAVLVAGAATNIVAAFVLLTAGFAGGWPQPNLEQPTAVYIGSVAPGSPAQEAGVLSGDIVLEVNSRSVKTTDDLKAAVDEHTTAHPGEALAMHVRREGGPLSISLFPLSIKREMQERTIEIVPRTNPPPGQGKLGVVLGQEYATDVIYEDLPTAANHSALTIGRIMGFFVEVPSLVVRGLLPIEAVRPVSVVGISQMGAEAIRTSQNTGQWWYLIQLTAMVSVALAVSNLLPLPALDGGRILFVLIEAVRGRRIAPERETTIHFIGMAMLLMLMVVLIINDLLNPLVGG